MGGAPRGDFGESYVQGRPVAEILRERVPRSLELAVFRWLPPLAFVDLWADPVENLKQLIWPALVQAYY